MSTIRVSLIQSVLAWEDKQANLAMFEEKMASLSGKTDVVVLPEMFTTGFSMQAERLAETMEGESVNWMKRMAFRHRLILTGSLIITEGGKCYNRMIWMLPNGHTGIYDKRHLFGFAGEDAHYSPGNKRLIAMANGWRFNLQVCYDLRFPAWTRQGASPEVADKNSSAFVSPEYDALIYIANWPKKRSHAWKTLLAARAIENQCYVIGVNRVGADGAGIEYSGDSMLIGPLGETLYHKADAEDIFTFTLNIEELIQVRNSFPFLKDRDAFTFVK